MLTATIERGDWLRLLARWGLFTALVVAGLMVSFFTALSRVSSRPGAGGDHDELLMAAFEPGLYRTAMVFDALGWLAMGGLVVIAGLALARKAPVRGSLAGALGVTAIAGIIGAFLRLAVVGDLGGQLAVASGADEAGILAQFRTVDRVIAAHFAAGQLTIGLGFLALGTAALGVAWVPRPIAWLLLVPGLTSLALLVGEVAFDAFLFPVLLVHVILLAAAGLAAAARWWRVPSPAPAAAAIEPSRS